MDPAPNPYSSVAFKILTKLADRPAGTIGTIKDPDSRNLFVVLHLVWRCQEALTAVPRPPQPPPCCRTATPPPLPRGRASGRSSAIELPGIQNLFIVSPCGVVPGGGANGPAPATAASMLPYSHTSTSAPRIRPKPSNRTAWDPDPKPVYCLTLWGDARRRSQRPLACHSRLHAAIQPHLHLCPTHQAEAQQPNCLGSRSKTCLLSHLVGQRQEAELVDPRPPQPPPCCRTATPPPLPPASGRSPATALPDMKENVNTNKRFFIFYL
jgi:hypothetical protein